MTATDRVTDRSRLHCGAAFEATNKAERKRRPVAESQRRTEKARFAPIERLNFRVFPEARHLDVNMLAYVSCAYIRASPAQWRLQQVMAESGDDGKADTSIST
jgi:hypothetical protein